MAISKVPPQSVRATMRIGELARRTGRSVHAIRWYESIGPIPGVGRDAGKRRVYDERHVGWLDLMHRLRLTGMPTAKMREYAALAALSSRNGALRFLFLTERSIFTVNG
jgi:DNA-binding transcriptional MerR regulator